MTVELFWLIVGIVLLLIGWWMNPLNRNGVKNEYASDICDGIGGLIICLVVLVSAWNYGERLPSLTKLKGAVYAEPLDRAP